MSSSFIRTDCFFNLTTDERFELFKRQRTLRLDGVYRHYFGYLPLPFALLALLFGVIYVITVYNAVKAHRVSRKCYVLLLNRTVGDILCCVSALITAAYVLFSEHINRDVVAVMETFFIGCFWSAMVSYVAISVLKFYAVWRPFSYMKTFTMMRCIYVIVLSWVIFILMVLYTLTVSALVKIPMLNEWSGCKMETCLRLMYRGRNAVTVAVYFSTLIVFCVTVLLIRRAQRFAKTLTMKRPGNQSRTRYPLWKLSLNVGTFAVLNVFYVVWGIALLLNRNQCFFQRNYAEMMRLLGIIRCTLLLRILIDPIISFMTDFQIRRGVLTWFGLQRRITANSRNGFVQRSTVSDDNSTSMSGKISNDTVKTVC